MSDLDDTDFNELQNRDRAARWHDAALLRHPDPRDPDHPDCDRDEDEEGEAANG
ncbi:hypothetical protein GT347_20125 [Xylophilus rhododendri]|uniref:Uncharacterized protein n=1 Tax=Xylophilus rhododendri TaxID=2697032 RepID=A0A857JAS7_9BURK|nr:hypothetical protein [Xylophilus rhododendri]QHJ00083.1 hypothetical protein GT347_20125 [Xylophilus rhododendri]